MPSSFSPNLRLELIANGEQTGSWGTTTNTNLGTLVEGAIAGLTTVSVTTANQALTTASGAADQARMAIIKLTTTTGAGFSVYAPPASKTYVVWNTSAYTATIYNSTVIGNTTAAGTGVTIPAGATVAVVSDGANFVLATNRFTGVTIDSSTLNSPSMTNPSYTGTFTGGTGVVDLGAGQFYKAADGKVGVGTSSPAYAFDVIGAIRAVRSNILAMVAGSSGVAIRNATDSADLLTVSAAGDVSVPGALNVTGAVSVTEGVSRPAIATTAISTTSSFTYNPATHRQVATLTLTNTITVTFAAPTNITAGAMYKFLLTAGDTNARSFAWNAAYKFPAATPPLTSGSNTSGAVDIITFIGGAGNTLIYDGHIADVR